MCIRVYCNALTDMEAPYLFCDVCYRTSAYRICNRCLWYFDGDWPSTTSVRRSPAAAWPSTLTEAIAIVADRSPSTLQSPRIFGRVDASA